MIKNFFKLLPLAVSCVLWPPAPLRAQSTDLKPLMRQNFRTMFELQTLALDPGKFSDPKNEKAVREAVERLAGISHVLPETLKDERPGQAAVAAVFARYLADLKAHLDRGNPEFLRNRVRTATGFCFECHTSLSVPGGDVRDAEKRLDASNFPPAVKAEFYAATRQFDKAAEAYARLLGHGGREVRPEDVSEVVRSALSLAVRVKRDPELALEYLQEAENLKAASPAYRDLVAAWKKDAERWKRNEDTPKDGSTASAGSWLAFAKSLIRRAEGLRKFPADHAGDISFFRAVEAAHEAVSRVPSAAQKAEGFQLLGDAYGALEDPLLWALDDYYYEACILAAPHSKASRSCYERLSRNVTFGFTGSAGTNLPPEERTRLRRLELLAK